MTRDEAVGRIVGLALALPDHALRELTDSLFALMKATWDEGYEAGVDAQNPYTQEN